jgi:hypothetical protein
VQVFRRNTQADSVKPSLGVLDRHLGHRGGIAFSVVSPWSNSGVSATTFKIGPGLYFCDKVDDLASKRRLSSRPNGSCKTRRYTSAIQRMLFLWAAASVLGAVLLAFPVNLPVGATLAGTIKRAANVAQSSPTIGYVDTPMRLGQSDAQGQQSASDNEHGRQ